VERQRDAFSVSAWQRHLKICGGEELSAIQVSPYVNFQGRAREAMEYYQQVLGGTLDLRTVNERGESRPAGPGDRVMYARLAADGVVIIGSDGHPDYPPKVGDNMAIALSGADKDRLTRIFNALAEGGKIKGPLTEQPGGSAVGWLADQFGMNWMITVEKA
jgi:PhnB protein